MLENLKAQAKAKKQQAKTNRSKASRTTNFSKTSHDKRDDKNTWGIERLFPPNQT